MSNWYGSEKTIVRIGWNDFFLTVTIIEGCKTKYQVTQIISYMQKGAFICKSNIIVTILMLNISLGGVIIAHLEVVYAVVLC